MAVRSITRQLVPGRAALLGRLSLAAVLGAAVPLVFLHVHFQPGFGLGVAGARAKLSDFAVLGVVLAALAAGRRDGFAPLRRGLPIFVPALALLALIAIDTFLPVARDDAYDWKKHLVTALTFGEYALLAPAVVLLARRARDLEPLLAALVVWSAVATVVAALQFTGVVSTWDDTPSGRRKPSLLGYHDFAALSGAVLALGLIGIAIGDRRRRWAWAATASGGLGLVLSGAVSALLGLLVAVALVLVVTARRGVLDARRAAAVLAVTALVGAGTVALRSANLESLFLGRGHKENVESYSQRRLLAYVGVRIFADHPALGVGWQGSTEEFAYGPYLADAHRRYPDQPDLAFPSPEHPYGVQNGYIQALADLGLPGLALLLATLAAGLWLGLRAAARSVVALAGACWILVAMGVWLGIGLVAGIPLDALAWLALGVVVVGD